MENARQVLAQKRINKKKTDEIHSNVLRKGEDDDFENFIYDDEESKDAQIRSLKGTIKHLHNVIQYYKLKDKKSHFMRNLSTNISQKREKNENENKDEEENDKHIETSFIKQIFIETIIDNLCEKPNNHEFPFEFVCYCYCLYSMCPNSYFLLREVLDLPCETTLKNYFSQDIKNNKLRLTDFSKTAEIIYNYRYSNNIIQKFDAILGVDAASFDRKNGEGDKFMFLFFLQPIDPEYKCLPLFIYPTLNGHAHQDIIFIFESLIAILSQCDINIVYTATDGDTFYNHINEETFDEYVLNAFKGGFYAAIESWSNLKTVKRINDMLHCLKLARKRLQLEDIVLNNTKLIDKFDYKTFEKALRLGKTLTDDSDFAKMSDYNALNLFSFQNIEILLKEDKLNLALYLLPFTCWAESLINNSISKKTRLNLLQIAFDVLYQFYIQNNCFPRLKGVTFRNNDNSIALTFGDNNFLIRCLNSIVGTGFSILKYNHIGLDRIGTQIIENFFGHVRISCNHFDSYERILSVISNTIIRNNILNQYQIDIQIEKRANTGGVHLYSDEPIESDYYDEIVYIPYFLFQLTGVTALTATKQQLYTDYQKYKNLFLELIGQVKNDKKKLFERLSSKKTKVFSRCANNA